MDGYTGYSKICKDTFIVTTFLPFSIFILTIFLPFSSAEFNFEDRQVQFKARNHFDCFVEPLKRFRAKQPR
eukprot:Gb_11281 [translate_table: standard]